MWWFIPAPSGNVIWWSLIGVWSVIAMMVAYRKHRIEEASRKEDDGDPERMTT